MGVEVQKFSGLLYAGLSPNMFYTLVVNIIQAFRHLDR